MENIVSITVKKNSCSCKHTKYRIHCRSLFEISWNNKGRLVTRNTNIVYRYLQGDANIWRCDKDSLKYNILTWKFVSRKNDIIIVKYNVIDTNACISANLCSPSKFFFCYLQQILTVYTSNRKQWFYLVMIKNFDSY